MQTLQVTLNDQVSAALDSVSARQQRPKEALIGALVEQFVRSQQAREALQDAQLVSLYDELADEDVALAEVGLADYTRGLDEADRL